MSGVNGRRCWALLRRELWSLFFTPLGWIVLTLFLLIQGYSFYLYIELVSRPEAPHGAVMQFFFGGTLLYWIALITVTSVTTMRLLAPERKSGTLELVLTTPASAVEVVLAKYAASLIYYLFLWLPTLGYVAILAALSPDPVPAGPILAGYLGTVAVGASFLALGLWASALFKQQVAAALFGFSLMTTLLLLGAVELLVQDSWLHGVLKSIDLFAQMDAFARGIVDSRALIYHSTLVIISLTLATRTLERRRWR